MNIQSKFAIGTIASCFLLLAIHPDSAFAGVGFISSITLFGFLEFMEQKGKNEIQELRELMRSLKDRVDALQIGRGLGR